MAKERNESYLTNFHWRMGALCNLVQCLGKHGSKLTRPIVYNVNLGPPSEARLSNNSVHKKTITD